ncbi:MAG: DUF368 domain-containing protein [Candidatus Omnitrophica bacterium]|nr:DUF368 domain-containing protein [Candidatus Omnitrophota bacterium]
MINGRQAHNLICDTLLKGDGMLKEVNFRDKCSLFLKGILMGICDVIPGISGGTIAFITGIYEQLIDSVKNISPELIKSIFLFLFTRRKSKVADLIANVKKIDLIFLGILFSGIFTAIFLGSKLILFLLDNYFVYTISFFIGLILASSKVIFNNIENHKIKNILFGFLGVILGIILTLVVPLKVNNPSHGYVFFGGFFAISAMFLPGISGAFILDIMGIYPFMLNVLHNIRTKYVYFLVFGIGAALGAFFISRLIVFLFKKDKCKTLYVLLGLVIGSLSIPVKKVIGSGIEFTSFNIIGMLLLFFLGFVLTLGINNLGQKRG